ncbi:hypothetical protein PR048_024663 [Dryococelus australis]|uniref:Integrase catalytic domain-containing protein n=1 Tax=Dryococelus australis TaxID=614101 RepID=A0ABQ9GP63_9NEOP|nr:hypothetical protein PR048_024663 [Dryococelus australis]
MVKSISKLSSKEQSSMISSILYQKHAMPLQDVYGFQLMGGVHLCVVYKVGLNECLQDVHYPIRIIDDILNSLRNSRFFSRLDLFEAYLHVPVDEQSSEIQTISTHRKVAAIVDMPRPKSTEDVRRFLGMVTYYSQFIHGASTITTPLHCLLCKNAIFKWTSACEVALLKLKQAIASNQVLVPYNPDLSVQLACDASPKGIDGVLSHIVDGHEHPIAFVSREPDYIIESGITFHVQRVLVPASLQSAVLDELRRTHVGITKMKQLAKVMVSDNATIFTSEEFAQFCKEAGIFQKICAAGHPATNGLAECNVQMLNQRLATMSNQNMHIQIMDLDVVLSEAEQIKQEEELSVVDFQLPEQPAQQERPQR